MSASFAVAAGERLLGSCRARPSLDTMGPELTSELRFERPVTYRDRAVRYLVEVDGQPLAPRLAGLDCLSTQVSSGDHLVRVSAGGHRCFEARISVAGGETASFRVVPGPLWTLGPRVPRLVDLATGRLVPGAVGRRAQRPPAHLGPGDS